MKLASQESHYQRYSLDRWETVETSVIAEAPVTLTVNGTPWLEFMCTPVDLEALAAGFLFNEGVIQSRVEIADVRLCETGDNVDAWLTHGAEKPAQWRRTSGCTGGATAVTEDSVPAAVRSFEAMLTPQDIFRLVSELFKSQVLFQATGGVHTSILSDGQAILAAAEDIGRHNTLDKIAGRCLLDGIAPSRSILLTTGRVSSEMLQKAARIGALVVISLSSPSSLSIELAQRYGITLVGYARRDRFNVYTYPERVAEAPKPDANVELPAPLDACHPTL